MKYSVASRRNSWKPLLGVVGLLMAFHSGLSAEKAEVAGFSPEGTVKDVRQVRATFSEPITAFGDPRGSGDPFDISCEAAGRGRWADGKNWIYDFDADLPAGIRCSFKLKAGLKSLAGVPLAGKTDFAFDTGGPAIKRSEPWEGSQIDEEQVFILSVDAPAQPKSVLENAYFTVAGIQERIPVKILDEDPRKAAPGGASSLGAKVRLWAGKFGRPTRVGTRRTGRAEVVLQAQRRFPPGAKVTLYWGAGISTPQGVATKAAQLLPFTARPEFSAEFNCERENAAAACIPISPMALNLNADVAWGLARKIKLRSQDGQEWKPFLAKGQTRDDEEGVTSVTFQGPFPEKTHFEITLPGGMRDDAGRPLANLSRFPLSVATAEFSPLIKFPADFGILELQPEAVLPVTVRNVEASLQARLENAGAEATAPGGVGGKVLRVGGDRFAKVVGWLGRLNQHRREVSIFSHLPGDQAEPLVLPKPHGDKAFEVMGIPLKKAGFYVVEFESPRLGASLLDKKGPMFVPAEALVTNLSVHFKQGRESSLIWVTSLDQGKPVEGALVSVRDCSGKILAEGKTDAHGVAPISRSLPSGEGAHCGQGHGYSEYWSGLYAVAEKDDDFSFVHSSWEKGIESWRFNLPGADSLTPQYASTVFDRTLFRAGEQVRMKHYFRRHSMSGMGLADGRQLPAAVQIRHEESDQTYELPLSWRAGSVAETSWSIPKGAKLGGYSVTLLQREPEGGGAEDEVGRPGVKTRGFQHGRRHRHLRGASSQSWRSGEFRVEEYRVPLMRGKIKPPAEDLVLAKEVPFDFSVEYLSGGAAAKLPVQLRHQTSLAPSVVFPEYDDYVFGTGKARDPGGAEDAALAPGEVELDLDAPAPEATTGPESAGKALKQEMTLDQGGTGRFAVKVPEKNKDQLRNLRFELDYRDPNGETQTVARAVTLYPSARLIAIKPNSWFATKKSLKFQVAVTDLHGKAAVHAPVEVEFIERKTYSHRKRLVGGFYSYENHSELKRHGRACKGTTDEKGLLECDAVPPVSGNLILEGRTQDAAGNPSFSNSSTWVYDSEEWWFSQEDSDRIDLLPERKRYESGEKAVFQVRMPFREATALVTVEREGIIDSFVVPLSGKKPLIEVPIKPEYSPNVFVSALVVRGRVGEVQPTALVDLGRPSYKLGIGELHVGWKPHELSVRVLPSKDVFQIREKGRFRIRVQTVDGRSLPAGSEVALAAVDEGLLQLKPNESWKLLDSMMRSRGYEVRTFTGQSQVIGKRHFGLKALPPGGDGGKAPARELFDSLLYWNGNVSIDEKGEAEVAFPMNDSTTGFRVAAVAHAGGDLFGTGYATIRTTQDLMILSGVPPLAREGDHLTLDFTLRNTTGQPMSLVLTGKASGVADFSQADFALGANEARQVRWPVEIPAGISNLKYEFQAKDLRGKASDGIRITQKVVPAVPVRVFQATLLQVDGKSETPVEKPKDALSGRGGVRVILDPTLLTGLDGVREYMGEYPYSCLEQRVSKAVALRDVKLWKAIVEDLPSYLDEDGLAKYFPSGWIRGSDILTSYVLAISNEAGWDFPKELRSRMLGGLKGFIQGKVSRISDLPTADLTVRKIDALEAVSRYGEASWAMTGSLQLQPNLWPTSALIDWAELLKRLKDAPEAAARRQEASQILKSRLNFQGTLMGFSTENVDQLWWMMVSTSTNANRFLLSVLEDPLWKEDMGRVARGALYRQRQGHWDTTTANAWGVLALEKFASLFEKTAVSGSTSATIDSGNTSTLNWAESPKGKVLDFAWPSGPGRLTLAHSGAGKPWATLQSRAAIPLKEPLFTGYRVTKTWTAVERKSPGKWSKGDIARIHLDMESQTDMTWVVVSDPIPAGSMILGSGLGNDSGIATAGEKSRGWAEPAFQERMFEGYRAYYQFVPKGKWSTEYTVRFNQGAR